MEARSAVEKAPHNRSCSLFSLLLPAINSSGKLAPTGRLKGERELLLRSVDLEEWEFQEEGVVKVYMGSIYGNWFLA